MGLSIVRRLTALMGGEVGVDSTLGLGSEFWIEVPLNRSRTILDDSLSGIGALVVLVALTEAVDCDAVRLLTRELGMRVEVVGSLEEIRRRLHTADSAVAPVQVLIADERLPQAELTALLAALEREEGAVLQALVTFVHPGSDTTQIHLEHPMLRRPLSAAGLFNALNAAILANVTYHEIWTKTVKLDALQAQLLPDVVVLVVDDSQINLEIARRILAHEGARVLTAVDGHQALHLLRSNPAGIDVVLMDVQMPGIDGPETTRQLRRLPGLERLPVIALTAGALLAEKQRALESGMDAFVSKPFEPQGLIRVVRRQLELALQASVSVRERVDAELHAPVLPAMKGIERAVVAAPLRHDVQQFAALLRLMLDEVADLFDGAASAPVPTDADARKQHAARIHKLRGSAGLLGAMTVHRYASAIEMALKSQAPDERLPQLSKQTVGGAQGAA